MFSHLGNRLHFSFYDGVVWERPEHWDAVTLAEYEWPTTQVIPVSGPVLTSHHSAVAFFVSVFRSSAPRLKKSRLKRGSERPSCHAAAGLLQNFLRGDVIAVNLQQDRSLQKGYRENEPQTLL